ncbi:MAG: MCE family protein [Bdellovibrionales bacterium]|nr:MCE family protein [Bdellovibrionales bacterium]
MEPEARYTLVGLTLISLVGLTVAAVLWLSRFKEQGQHAHYLIYFRHHSLSGLQEDSYVTMRGIRVGTVESVNIAKQDIELIRVEIEVGAETPVKTDTRAVVQRNLLTGLAWIDLIGSSQKSAPLVSSESSEDHPIIPEGESGLDVLRSTLPELMERVGRVVSRASDFLSKDNEKSLSSIIKNVEMITERVAAGQSQLNDTLDSISVMAKELKELSSKLDNRSDSVLNSLESATESVAREAASISQELGQTSQAITQTMRNYQDPQSAFFGPNPNMLGPGESTSK